MPNVTLESVFTDIAGAIRSKTGDAGLLVPTEMATAIEEIPTGGGDYDSGVWEIWDGTGTKLAAQPLDKSFYELQISSLVPIGSHTLIWVDDTDGEAADTAENADNGGVYQIDNGQLTQLAYSLSDQSVYQMDNGQLDELQSGIYLIDHGAIKESDTFGELPLKAVWYYDESNNFFFDAGLPNENFYCNTDSGWQLANFGSYFYGSQCLTEFHVGENHIAQNGYGNLSEVASHTLIWIDSTNGSYTYLSQADGVFQVENGVFSEGASTSDGLDELMQETF